jgi:hypothetical protein
LISRSVADPHRFDPDPDPDSHSDADPAPDTTTSVADPGCLSRIQKQQQKRGVKKICCLTFFCSHKFDKIVNYFIFEMLKKKIWANFQRNIELFT